MRKVRLLSLAVASLVVLGSPRAATFDDIQFWVGSGANRAGFVVDWNDGKSAESLLWGFRWDGAATGFDMFEAIIAADAGLFAHVGTFDFGSGPTAGVFGIGYDLNGDGAFGVSANPPLLFGPGGLTIDPVTAGDDNVDPAGTPVDPADHWMESWFPAPGFWGYYVKSDAAGVWDSALTGASERLLTDGSWDGYSFAPDFLSGAAPGEPIAVVPEPSVLTLGIVGTGLLLLCGCFRRIRAS